MSERPRAFVLAVGTELTTGQTLNRNAAWISQELERLGIKTSEHRTVADDRKAILRALSEGSRHSQLLFVTGGLGPTSDDFTREVIAEYIGAPLEYDPISWASIVERLSRRGVPIVESNKQQCYFPKGARVLHNSRGTANGFCVSTPQCQIFALPGPPREIEAIWKAELASDLARRFPDPDPIQLLLWQTLGQSESAIGEITEEALRGSGLQTGYRVHLPYVEVKVWVPQSRAERSGDFVSALDQALRPWTITKGDQDVAELFLCALQGLSGDLVIQDALTHGLIAERVLPLLRKPSFRALGVRITWVSGSAQTKVDIKIEPDADCGARLWVRDTERAIGAVFKSDDLKERNLRALTEKFFIESQRVIQDLLA
jgi:nicotinamide-nucleotide amidase